VTPSAIPFALFAEFNKDVADFVIGSEKPRVLQEVEVSIHEGSYLLRVIVPVGILSALSADVSRLQQPDALADLDPGRAEVVERWQQRTVADPETSITIRNPDGGLASVRIYQMSGFRRVERDQWIAIEQYLVGEITDWGGASVVNLHLRPRDSHKSKIVTIDATPDQIRNQEKNLVLHRAVVHVRGEKNCRTGELRNLKLLDLRPIAAGVDQAEMERFVAAGAKAWGDVPSGAAWVEEQRGNTYER
jgi:hypothetical protein